MDSSVVALHWCLVSFFSFVVGVIHQMVVTAHYSTLVFLEYYLSPVNDLSLLQN